MFAENLNQETTMTVEEEVKGFGNWYHKIDLGDGVYTPGERNQSLTFDLYRDLLPKDLSGLTVLDLGANACGFSIEFARRGARVTAVESASRYVDQAKYVVQKLGMKDRVRIQQMDLFDVHELGEFDIVAYVGLSYHVDFPELAIAMLSNMCRHSLVTSTQTLPGGGLIMENRAKSKPGRKLNELYGYEPTEELYLSWLSKYGFKNPRLVSTAPHAGEDKRNKLGNRSYFFAEAGNGYTLPFKKKRNWLRTILKR